MFRTYVVHRWAAIALWSLALAGCGNREDSDQAEGQEGAAPVPTYWLQVLRPSLGEPYQLTNASLTPISISRLEFSGAGDCRVDLFPYDAADWAEHYRRLAATNVATDPATLRRAIGNSVLAQAFEDRPGVRFMQRSDEVQPLPSISLNRFEHAEISLQCGDVNTAGLVVHGVGFAVPCTDKLFLRPDGTVHAVGYECVVE